MKTGIELIQQERNEQIHKHNRQVKQDVDYNKKQQLSFAAAILCCPTPELYGNSKNNYSCPSGWDLKIWMKMYNKPYKERLIIAGALIAAEIDRLQNSEPQPAAQVSEIKVSQTADGGLMYEYFLENTYHIIEIHENGDVVYLKREKDKEAVAQDITAQQLIDAISKLSHPDTSEGRRYTEDEMKQAFAEGHAQFTECEESELELKAENYLATLK